MECESTGEIPPKSVASVLYNIVTRSATGFCPPESEYLYDPKGITWPVASRDVSESVFTIEPDPAHIAEALRVVSKEKHGYQLTESAFERWFLDELAQQGLDVGCQLFERQQRPTRREEDRRRTDFAWTPPGSKEGVAVEIDGPTHDETEQILSDCARDADLKRNYTTVRIHHAEKEQGIAKLKEVLSEPRFSDFERMQKIYNGRTATDLDTLILGPLMEVRIHTAIAWWIRTHPAKWVGKKRLGVAITTNGEDYCDPQSALRSLGGLVRTLNKLAPEDQQLPVPHPADTPDITIDISIRIRSCWAKIDMERPLANTIRVRTAQQADEVGKRHLQGIPITYPSRKESAAAVNDLFHKVFRKKQARQGQTEIILSALTGQPTIGLLPTGKGKSLAYLLCTLLQPGPSVVICPLVGLMANQIRGMALEGMDKGAYICGETKTEERTKILKALETGGLQVLLISPERMLTPTFKTACQEWGNRKGNCAYGVIDECHCVSEWGHDFRPAYLNVGRALQEFLPRQEDKAVPILAITATASFDVLTDVERELKVSTKENRPAKIIRHETVRRPELILQVNHLQKEESRMEVLQDLIKKPEVAWEAWNAEVAEEHQLGPEEKGTTVIFFATVGGRTGVLSVWDNQSREKCARGNLKKTEEGLGVGLYIGESRLKEKGLKEAALETIAELDAGELDILLASKAFSLGMNAPRIRRVIHTHPPNSIEALIQEVGRGGRDGRLCLCTILMTGGPADTKTSEYFLNTTFPGPKKEYDVMQTLLEEMEEAGQCKETGAWILPFRIEVNLKELPGYKKLEKFIGVRQIEEELANIKKWGRASQTIRRLAESLKITIREEADMGWEALTWEEEQDLVVALERDGGEDKDPARERALYRFGLLGVIKNYQTDYSNHHFVVWPPTAKQAVTVRENLQEYISRYLCPEAAEEYLRDEVPLGESEDETRANALLGFCEFVDTRVKKKRALGIKHTQRLLLDSYRRAEGDPVRVNRILQQEIDLYFNARYSRRGYSENGQALSLTDDLESKNGPKWEDLIRKYIGAAIATDRIDCLKHLRGACLRLKEEHPDRQDLVVLETIATFWANGIERREIDDATDLENFSIWEEWKQKDPAAALRTRRWLKDTAAGDKIDPAKTVGIIWALEKLEENAEKGEKKENRNAPGTRRKDRKPCRRSGSPPDKNKAGVGNHAGTCVGGGEAHETEQGSARKKRESRGSMEQGPRRIGEGSGPDGRTKTLRRKRPRRTTGSCGTRASQCPEESGGSNRQAPRPEGDLQKTIRGHRSIGQENGGASRSIRSATD
jgi:ATP-dependent DNA helicase RecQ